MESYIQNRRVIWMTMILSLLIMPLYIFSYSLQNWKILIILFIFERLATPFTGKSFGDALEQVGDLLDQNLNRKEAKKLLVIIVTLIGFVITMISLYLYILFTAPFLFILLMIAELIDKGIDKFILKRA